MYIPKSVLLGFLFAAIGLVAGWALHGSANDVASASYPAPTVLQDAPASAAPPVDTGVVRGTTTSITAGPGATAATSDTPVGALSGDSSTVSTTIHIERRADGGLVGTSSAVTRADEPVVPAVPAVPAVPTGPAGPRAPTTPALEPPATTPAIPSTPTAPSSAAPSPVPAPAVVQPTAATLTSALTVTAAPPSAAQAGQGLTLQIPPTFAEQLFVPLPGAKSRGVAFSEWESYRTDVAGRNIMVTTDDSNVFKDRNGKINGNTGDTDASGLNVTDATDSVIRGTESADEAPYQTVTQGIVDIATANPTDLADLTNPSSEDDGDANLPDPGANGPVDTSVEATTLAANAAATRGTTATSGLDATGDTDTGDPASTSATPKATAAVKTIANATPPNSPSAAAAPAETDASGGSDSSNDGYDFPYVTWANAISADSASAVHTDEGTTMSSGQDALVIGADGYDDDDNRATGENIIITRDDGNVVLGGTGDVNAQVGDSEQGAVIMGVTRTFIQGGGAY